MGAIIPPGLITIGQQQISQSLGDHEADIRYEHFRILHSFWKVHAIRAKVSKSVSDKRSQNLFWRTWGDYGLSHTITASTLSKIWRSCQEEIDLECLRPRGYSQSAERTNDSNRSHKANDHYELRVQSRPRSKPENISRPPRNLAFQDDRSQRRSVDDSGPSELSVENSAKVARSTRPVPGRVASGNARPSFGASSTRVRNRPSLSRRKSSQVAAQNKAAKLAKSIAKSQESPFVEGGDTNTEHSDAVVSAFQLPSASSWEDEPHIERDLPLRQISQSGVTSDPLVEPDFRTKFAERVASSSNLTGMNKIKKTGSVVRFADSVPTDLEPGKTNYAKVSELELGPIVTLRSSDNSVASTAVIDEDEASLPRLQRSKSQLSMMIGEKISQQGRRAIVEMSPAGSDDTDGQMRRQAAEKDKLLVMAHGEGVTKAGGAHLSRRFTLSDEGGSRYSSPSPPPIF